MKPLKISAGAAGPPHEKKIRMESVGGEKTGTVDINGL